MVLHRGHQDLSNTWNPSANQFGALPFIYGTAVTAIIALVMAVPVSVAIALLLTEVVPRRWARPIVYVIDLLAVVPSVVWGLWGILVFAPWIQHFYGSVSSGVNGIPVLDSLFGGQVSGASCFTAGIILAFMITPIVTSLSREVIATVPAIDKEGAYALGATRLEMIRGAVRRTARRAWSGRCCWGWAGPWAKRSRSRWSSAGQRLSHPTCSPRATTCRGNRERVRRGLRAVPGRIDRDGRSAFRVHDHHQRCCPRGRGAFRPATEGGVMAATTGKTRPAGAAVLAADQEPHRNHTHGYRVRAGDHPARFVLYTVIAKGASIISWQFLTASVPPNMLRQHRRQGPAVAGTLEISALAAVMASRSACWVRYTRRSAATGRSPR